MSAKDSMTRTERLVKVLQIQNPTNFQERILQVIRRKLEFMASKNEVEKATHLELQYIAKVRPDAYRSPAVMGYFSSVVDGDKIPKALLPTLFMIYGKVYLHDPYPPAIMAKILYRDVIGSQDICMWGRQDVCQFVCRVQLAYFFEGQLLSDEAKLLLVRYYQPTAREVPANFACFDKSEAEEVMRVYSQIDETVKRIEMRKFDRDSLECLKFFLQRPVPRRILLEHYQTIANEFPEIVPQLLVRVQFFLNYAVPNNPRVIEFLNRFCMLNSSKFVEEMKQTLTTIAGMNSVYSSIVLNAKMLTNGTDKVSDISNSAVAVKLLGMDCEHDIEKIKQDFREFQPVFATSYDLLMSVLNEAKKLSESLANVYVIFKCVLMYTQFDSQLEKVAQLISAYLVFLRTYGGSSFQEYALASSGIVCPRACAQSGLPFCTEGFCGLLEDAVSLPLAYEMVCAAAKYQSLTNQIAVIGADAERVARLLVGLSFQPDPKVRLQAWIISCLLVVVSPTGIGAQIYRNDQWRKMLTEFISNVLRGGTIDELGLDWAISQSNATDIFPIIMHYASLKVLSGKQVLACRQPAYLEDMILFADITGNPPPWLMRVDERRIEAAPNQVLIRYVLLRFTEMFSKAKDMSIRRLSTCSIVTQWKTVIFNKGMKRDELAEFTKLYAPLLADNSRIVRLAAYVVNMLLNSEIVYAADDTRSINPRFALPVSPEIIALIAKTLYMENDPDAMRSYIDYLSEADQTRTVLRDFIARRPLLCHSLHHKVLISMMATQYDPHDMDLVMRINYSMPDYSILNVSESPNSNTVYHTLPLRPEKVVDLDTLPVYEPLPHKSRNEHDDETVFEIPKVSKIEEEIYRCEIAFHRDRPGMSRLIALAAMKRYISMCPEAFLLYAEPELYMLSHEYQHCPVIPDKLKTSLFYFLILCMYRRERVPRRFTQAETAFFEQLRTKLQELDMAKLEDEPIIADLRDHLTGTETESSKLASSVVPKDMPWNMFVSHNHLFKFFVTSLELSEPEYADAWMTKLCLYHQDAVSRPDLREPVVLPLLLSCSQESVAAFFALASESDFGSGGNPYQQMRQFVHEQIALLYPPVNRKRS